MNQCDPGDTCDTVTVNDGLECNCPVKTYNIASAPCQCSSFVPAVVPGTIKCNVPTPDGPHASAV